MGVIGVVAALTLPTLIQKYNNNIAETSLKKFYTTMNQALLRSVQDNGDYMQWTDYWQYNDIKDENGKEVNQQDRFKALFEKYFVPYLNIAKVEDYRSADGEEPMYLYYFSDGSAFSFTRHENRDMNFYPKNAKKCFARIQNGESVAGICYFSFTFYPLNSTGPNRHLYKKGFEPFAYSWNGNEAQLYSGSERSCSLGRMGNFCTGIIQHNGWKVPKDYPRKIQF